MINVDWKKFETKNPNKTDAFETLCYYLFCRKFNLTEGIRTDFNQVGIETEPVKDQDGEYWGFQSKYFEKDISYTSIKGSIEKALDKYSELDHIIIYLNHKAKTTCKNAQRIEKLCEEKNVKIEWFLPENFNVILNDVKNRDLAEFYFGETDVIRILSDSKNMRINTLLQSKEYMELNLSNNSTSLTISEYSNQVINSDKKLYLLSGAAGSGKSVCMRKLFNIYSGFDCKTEAEQLEVVNRIGAICIFVNLNKTSLDSLENIILAHKQIYSADSPNNKYVYLLDGFDEIPSSSVTTTSLMIEELLESESTKKIIISSRLSSYNKFILKATFADLEEYTIENLSKEQIEKFFQNKNSAEKLGKLYELSDKNENVYKTVENILTLTFLWENILKITGVNFLSELMELSINNILNDAHHKKYLDILNLPNPKDNSIIEINKKLAIYLFENDKFCFEQGELQRIIITAYPKCDYSATNQIVSFLADNFFDISTKENIQTFSYRHRRFSEYFTLLCIADKIQSNMNYLREKDIIINQDLFDKMLILYLQSKAKRNKDLPLAFEVGLLNVYMGNDKAWGVDNAFYYWSNSIIFAITALPNNIFQNVIEDNSLPICKFFSDMPEKIISVLSKSEKPYYHADFNQYYTNFILLIVQMHKCGKKDFLPQLLDKYEKIKGLSKEKKYFFISTSNRENYLIWENIHYIETVIYENDIDKIIKSIVEKTKETNIDDLFVQDIDLDVLISSSLYCNLLRYYPGKCVKLVQQMNLNQMSVFLFVASRIEFLNIILNDSDLRKAFKDKFEAEIIDTGLSAVLCLALKQRLEMPLTQEELEIVFTYVKDNPFRSHFILWKEYFDTVALIFSAFPKQIKPFQIEKEIEEYVSSYDAYIKLLNGDYTIYRFISQIRDYFYSNSRAGYHIRVLLGKILAVCDVDIALLKSVVEYLNYEIKQGGMLVVCHTMKLYNSERFDKIISNSALNKLNNPKVYQDIDYTGTSDLLFMLSSVVSSHDELLSYRLLLKGLGNGMMRMNDRKDTIGDYRLLESLEQILKNNWFTAEQLIGYLDRIILIANKMNKYHIENEVHGKTIELLLNYDFEAAEYYYNKVSSFKETYDQIHYDFAKNLVFRGRSIRHIENCLSKIMYPFSEDHQKIEWSSFYYKISVYLNIALCDFYSSVVQNSYFEKACEEIDRLEEAGWERELKADEYDLYVKLCNKRQKEIDVCREKDVTYNSISSKQEINSLEKLQAVHSTEMLKEFIEKIQRDYTIDSHEINELLIQKSVELAGNIDDILNLFLKNYYPSSVTGSINNHNFWMTVVAAIRNPKAKSSIMEYLLIHGGGHDGFNELIKIYGELKNKDVCLEAFESLVKCIEFLLYEDET